MSLIIVSGLEKNHINLNKDDKIIAGNWTLMKTLLMKIIMKISLF